MFYFCKKITCFYAIIIIIFIFISGCSINKTVIKNNIEPKNIGLTLNYKYNHDTIEPTIDIEWSWRQPKKQLDKNIQDIVAIMWNDENVNWVGTTMFGESGGGPAMNYFDYLVKKANDNEQGYSYFGYPARSNNKVTFKLLSSRKNPNPKIPDKIYIYFIHPEHTIIGENIIYVIKEIAFPS